jgi:hypothetical protein
VRRGAAKEEAVTPVAPEGPNEDGLDKLAGKIRFEIVSRRHPSDKLFTLSATRLRVLRWQATSRELRHLTPYEAFLRAEERSVPFMYGFRRERKNPRAYIAGRIPGVFGPYDTLEIESLSQAGSSLVAMVKHRHVAGRHGEEWAAARAYFFLLADALPPGTTDLAMKFRTTVFWVEDVTDVRDAGNQVSWLDNSKLASPFLVRISRDGVESALLGERRKPVEANTQGERSSARRSTDKTATRYSPDALKFQVSARQLAQYGRGSGATDFNAFWWALPAEHAMYVSPHEAYLLSEEQASDPWRLEEAGHVEYIAGRAPGEVGCLDRATAVSCSQEEDVLVFNVHHVRYRDNFHGFDWTGGRLYFMIREADIPPSVKAIELRFSDFVNAAGWGIREEGQPRALPKGEFIKDVTIDLEKLRREGKEAFSLLPRIED